MKKILITGGAGFIGYHLTKYFSKLNYKVDLVDNFSRGVEDIHLKKLLNENIKIINIDLLSSDINYIEKKDYDYIYHLAAIIGVNFVLKNPYRVLENNFKLLNNIIKFSQKQKNLNRFVFFSTSEVYASSLRNYGIDFPTPENTKLCADDLDDPRNSYALSKIYGESLCLHSDLPTTIIRPHNFYGPRMGMSHVIPELIKKIYFNDKESMKINSGDHSRTFLYISDAVKILTDLVKSDLSVGKSFNIGDESHELKIIDLAEIIAKNLKKEITFFCDKGINNSPSRRCPSMKNVYQIIQQNQLVDINDGVQKCFKWYLENVFNSSEDNAI